MSLSISVITPSLNQGQFIERTIQSVLTQKVESEYVIFDAASTDNTLNVLRKYESCIKWVSEPDAGQSDAVNKGIRATKGDIIAWINSDDMYLEDAFMEVKHLFEQHPLINVVYGNAWYIDINDNIMKPYMTEGWNIERLKETCFICQPAAFFRRKVVEQFGLLDTTLQYCMDYEFWLRLGLGKTQFAYLPKYLAASRLYPENKTLGQKTAVIVEINNMLKTKLGYVPDNWLYSYAFHEAEIMGYSSNKDRQNFLLQAARQSLSAAWRWNKHVSIKMLKQLIVWVKKYFL